MKKYRKLMALFLVMLVLVSSLPHTEAATSDELLEDLEELEEEAQEIQDKMDELEKQQNANWESIEEMVAYKSSVDQQIFLIYSQIDNLNERITAYSTMIVETQMELDAAQQTLDELNERYRGRIQAMEEEGEVSYWEVLFKANSFLDLIDRLNMIQEIAEADQRMMEKIRQQTEEVRQKKDALVAEKAKLEESRAELETAWAELEEKRAESDEILRTLNANHAAMEDLHDQYHAEKNALADEIAKAEQAYNEAVRAEEEERRRQEEEERRRQEEEDRRREEEEGSGSGGEGGEEDDDPPPANDSGWLMPCSYVYISSSYGWRSSGWHNGVDFAAYRGTPIYATRSGTVTKAISLTYSYGNYVVINHGDGFSSLYAHMDYFVVEEGQYVTQGQLIGYVGSTGNSTGNHLHLTFFYNGSTVNPMDYLN